MEGTLNIIEEGLALLEQCSTALGRCRTQCAECLHIHRSISPLRRLPADVLSEIFTQAAYSWFGVYSTPPWAISQTCSAWRALALDLPLLWNCIDIQIDENHKTYSSLQFLDMLLNRSREATLGVFISSRDSGFNLVQHPIIGILTKRCERWRHLHLQVSGQTLRAFKAVNIACNHWY